MGGTRVYVGGIPRDTRERDVRRFFEGFRLGEILLKNTFAFVEFDSSRDAEDAVYEMNGEKLFKKRVTVEIARSTPRGRDRSKTSRYTPDHRSRVGQRGPIRTKHRATVKNLSSTVSWQALKDYMRQAGEVTYGNVYPDRNKGEIEFASRSDLKAAVRLLDGTELNGRRIRIEEDEDERDRRDHSSSDRSSRNSRSFDRRSRTRTRTRSSTRSHSRTRSPSRSKSYSRAITNSRVKSRSRSRAHMRVESRSGTRSPRRVRSYSHARSPSRGRSRSKSPSGRRSPSHTRSHSRSRSLSRARSHNLTKSKSPKFCGSRRSSESSSRSRSRSGVVKRDVRRRRSRSRSRSDSSEYREEPSAISKKRARSRSRSGSPTKRLKSVTGSRDHSDSHKSGLESISPAHI